MHLSSVIKCVRRHTAIKDMRGTLQWQIQKVSLSVKTSYLITYKAPPIRNTKWWSMQAYKRNGKGEQEMSLEGFINVSSSLISQHLNLFINLTAAFLISLTGDITFTSSFLRI